MNCLDFLSTSPNFYIFQENRYKTNFGGVLFFLYLLIMLIISLAYILDFAFNPKYEIETSTIFINSNEKANPPPDPEIDLEIILEHYEFKDFSKSIFINDYAINYYYGTYNRSRQLIFHIKQKASLLKELKLFYATNISTDDADIFDLERPKIGSIEMTTKEIIIDHYGPIPLKNAETYNYDSEIHISPYKNFFRCDFKWVSILYSEKQGISRLFNNILNIKPNYTTGYLDDKASYTNIYYNQSYLYRVCHHHNFSEHCPFIGYFVKIEPVYIDYKRKEISFTDILAKIGALFSTFNFFFSFINKFYSLNFDNYKIIQNIFGNDHSNITYIPLNKEIKMKPNQYVLSNYEGMENPLISRPHGNENDQSSGHNIINEASSTDENLEDINNREVDKVEANNGGDKDTNNEYSNLNLPKLSFFDFLFANMYCICCVKNKKQEIIKECNEIIAKISSIDKILVNMTILENIIMDYKWNNPELKIFKNNDLLKNLNKLINT